MYFYCTYPVTMKHEGNKHHFILWPAVSHLPCYYMKQVAYISHYLKK